MFNSREKHNCKIDDRKHRIKLLQECLVLTEQLNNFFTSKQCENVKMCECEQPYSRA